jgi:hypothetical protein
MVILEPLWRGNPEGIQQLDLHLAPTVVYGGDESDVLVATGKVAWSSPRWVLQAGSFLGVQPGDEVEMAVDVVSADQLALYNRSIHKEARGIYDAWHYAGVDLGEIRDGLTVTVTCRVNGVNREGAMHALFEGLVRVWLGRPS